MNKTTKSISSDNPFDLSYGSNPLDIAHMLNYYISVIQVSNHVMMHQRQNLPSFHSLWLAWHPLHAVHESDGKELSL